MDSSDIPQQMEGNISVTLCHLFKSEIQGMTLIKYQGSPGDGIVWKDAQDMHVRPKYTRILMMDRMYLVPSTLNYLGIPSAQKKSKQFAIVLKIRSLKL